MSKSLLSLEDVLNSSGGVHVLGTGELFFTDVQTDSRNVVKNTLFVPLIGENQDGHKYIPQAIEKGASVVLLSLKNFESDSNTFISLSQNNPSVFFIAVDNNLRALQKIAGCYVEKFPEFKLVVFEEELIFNEEVEKWPIVESMIVFFSTGFPSSESELIMLLTVMEDYTTASHKKCTFIPLRSKKPNRI